MTIIEEGSTTLAIGMWVTITVVAACFFMLYVETIQKSNAYSALGNYCDKYSTVEADKVPARCVEYFK